MTPTPEQEPEKTVEEIAEGIFNCEEEMGVIEGRNIWYRAKEKRIADALYKERSLRVAAESSLQSKDELLRKVKEILEEILEEILDVASTNPNPSILAYLSKKALAAYREQEKGEVK